MIRDLAFAAAALTMAAAPIAAQAAPARVSSPMADREQAFESNGWVITATVTVLVFLGVLLLGDDDNDGSVPVSP